MIRIALLSLAALLAGCAALPHGPRHEIVGYYPGWKGAIEVDARNLTVINYAFLVLAPDGAVALDKPSADLENLARLGALKRRHPHLRLVASVGGWTRSDRFSDMAASPAARATFAASVVAFLRRHEFDGIDIDWEYPGAIGVPCAAGFTCDRPEDKRNFVTLARELRLALDAAGAVDGRRYLSTIAAGADRAFLFDGASADWMRSLAASLDWINLMTYDYHGTWETAAGLLAPLRRDPADPSATNVEATVEMYLREGIFPRQLTLGLPFYARGWTGCMPGPKGDGLYQMCAAALPDPAVAAPGSTRHWNAPAGVPYLYAPASGVFLTYEDERSIAEKIAYARTQGLLGAMYWEIAADPDGTLARVVARELERR